MRFERASIVHLIVGAVVLYSVTVTAVNLRGRERLSIDKPVENIRDEPNGEKIGTLLHGATVEKLSQDGKWVEFRVEGWIWGPSLDGFVDEEEEEEEGEERKVRTAVSRSPRPALRMREQVDRVKKIVEADYGVFYGVSLDKDLKQLVVRLRVRDISEEALERRQMAVQGDVLEALGGDVAFESIRVESNRADGSGQVGLTVAITEVEFVQRGEEADLAQWRGQTRFSSDGGETWKE